MASANSLSGSVMIEQGKRSGGDRKGSREEKEGGGGEGREGGREGSREYR